MLGAERTDAPGGIDLNPARVRFDAFRGFLLAPFFAERERWFLWLPVLQGLGVAVYFGLAVDPAPWLGPTLLIVVAAGAILAHARTVGLLPLLALGAIGAGFTLTDFAARQAAALSP